MNIHWDVTVYFILVALRTHRSKTKPRIVRLDQYEDINIRMQKILYVFDNDSTSQRVAIDALTFTDVR